MSPARFPYRVAIVTGAGKGIGRAVALILADVGVGIVANARTLADIEGLAAEIAAAGGACLPVAGDVAEEATAAALADAARDRFGGPCDLLVNAAGIQPPATGIDELPLAAWRETIEVNLTGTFLLCRAVLPEMKRMQRGRILNIASGLAVHAQPGLAAYGAAKAGVVQFSAVLAAEAAPFGITVNSLHPGIVDTALLRRNLADRRDGFARQMNERIATLKRISPEASARFIVWLAASSAENGAFVRIGEPEVDDAVSAFWRARAHGAET